MNNVLPHTLPPAPHSSTGQSQLKNIEKRTQLIEERFFHKSAEKNNAILTMQV